MLNVKSLCFHLKMYRFSTFDLQNPYDIYSCACYIYKCWVWHLVSHTLFTWNIYIVCTWNEHRFNIIGYVSLQSAIPFPMHYVNVLLQNSRRVTKTATDIKIDWVHRFVLTIFDSKWKYAPICSIVEPMRGPSESKNSHIRGLQYDHHTYSLFIMAK